MSVKKEEITVVLLGKVQSGESAIGNGVSETEDGSLTYVLESLLRDTSSENKQYKWHIFETPGIWKIERLEKADVLKELCNDMTRLMQHINQVKRKGITAFLLVFNNYTNCIQEMEMISHTYEEIFGESEFWKHCIIVFTGEGSMQQFDEWIKKQTGQCLQMNEKCKYRCVFISDRKDSDSRGTSRKRIETEITNLKNSPKQGYTLSHYMQNENKRNILVLSTHIKDLKNTYFTKEGELNKELLKNEISPEAKWKIIKKFANLDNEIEKHNGHELYKMYEKEFSVIKHYISSDTRYESCAIL